MIEHKAALKERRATLVTSLAVTSRLVEDIKESLDFSAAEHRFHMQRCDREHASYGRRLASLQTSLSAVRSSKDMKDAEIVTLRAQRDQASIDHRESLEGLQFRLKMVSEG